MTYEAELAQAETANGNDNPTLSFNLSQAANFSPGMQFLDLMKSMLPWIGHVEGRWGGMTTEQMRDGGYFDADGWLKAIPEGVQKVGTLFQWKGMTEQAEDRKGLYVLQYEGEGTLSLRGDAKIISSEPGKIVFENVTGDFNVYLDIFETDPAGTGDYIRNISLVQEKNMDLFEAGAMFNPDWLALIEDARELRFMDWMATNNSKAVTWDDMPSANGPNQGMGMPVEVMVRLANELGIDPWFNMPHMADEEYIRNFAAYVRDNLDPALKVNVEYSNEAWNWAFGQSRWLYAQSQEEWGRATVHDYYAKKAVETALIWDDVFGDQKDRVVNVLGTQTNNPAVLERILNPVLWKQYDPDGYVDPKTVFDKAGVTSYFTGNTVTNEQYRNEFLEILRVSKEDAAAWLMDKNATPDSTYRGSISWMKDIWEANAAIAHKAGLELVAYEGGQHMHHSFNVKGIAQEDIDLLTNFFKDFVRSEDMATLYQLAWDAWAEVTDGPFMQFGDISLTNPWGSWGLRNSLTDENPRAVLLDELNETSTPWWDAEGGTQYQQGVTREGTADDEVMIGTSQEDYLLGKGGNDVFIAGAGNDGINGGDGIDKVVLSGGPAGYTLREEGKGYRITGADGSDFLINVEELEFDNDQVVILADLVRQNDGTLLLPGTAVAPTTPTPPTDPEPRVPNETGRLKAGQVTDGSNYQKIAIDDLSGKQSGIAIKGISKESALGIELGMDDLFGDSPAYLAYVKGDSDPSAAFTTALLGAGVRPGPMAGPLDSKIDTAGIVTNSPWIIATKGEDSFSGLDARDIVSGSGGSDRLYGGGGDDSLSGNTGDDYIRGGTGDDLLRGQLGKDMIFGNDGDDIIAAGADNDTLFGGNGNDRLFGRLGNDILEGGTGNDKLDGGKGNDRLAGREGDDRFIFAKGSGTDKIVDFEAGDLLVLNDFFDDGQDVREAASTYGKDLMFSNGEDRILLLGLNLDDLDWVVESIV